MVNCLRNKRFDYYWYHSGTSLAAYKFRDMAGIYFNILSQNFDIDETLASVNDINDLTIESLLFQTGYLTIDNTIDVESEITRRREKGRLTGWQRPKQKQCSGAN
jgi:hypothetical protein